MEAGKGGVVLNVAEIGGFYFVIDRRNSDSDEFFWGPILIGITTRFLDCVYFGWGYNYL